MAQEDGPPGVERPAHLLSQVQEAFLHSARVDAP